MYQLSAPEMRLTVLFFDSADAKLARPPTLSPRDQQPRLGEHDRRFVFHQTQRSGGRAGWRCQDALFTVSGGSASITGIMVLDDLSVALAPRADLLPGNFWVNSTFEIGDSLDQTNGTRQTGIAAGVMLRSIR
jgi:hypothetical protein